MINYGFCVGGGRGYNLGGTERVDVSTVNHIMRDCSPFCSLNPRTIYRTRWSCNRSSYKNVWPRMV